MRAADGSAINAMGTGDDDTWFCPAAIWLEFWGATDDLRFASGSEIESYGALLTYTTVKESHHWIALEEGFQRTCRAGTDGIEINVVERSFVMVSEMSNGSFSEPLGCVDRVPRGKY